MREVTLCLPDSDRVANVLAGFVVVQSVTFVDETVALVTPSAAVLHDLNDAGIILVMTVCRYDLVDHFFAVDGGHG
jgi:hypothetical protein